MSSSVKQPSVEENVKAIVKVVRELAPDADVMLMAGLFDGEVSGVWLEADDDEDAVLAEELGPGLHLVVSLGVGDWPEGVGFHVLE